MLSQLRVHSTIAVKDLERARAFYKDKLGLEPIAETPGGLMYHCAEDTRFVLFPSPSAGTAQNTVMGWKCDDIKKEVAELKAKGVVFEEYDSPDLKTEDSVATTPAGQAAWFKDSEGNTLGLVQFQES